MSEERIDWALYRFHMAGIQDLHKDIIEINDLLSADKFIAEEVSYPSIKEKV